MVLYNRKQLVILELLCKFISPMQRDRLEGVFDHLQNEDWNLLFEIASQQLVLPVLYEKIRDGNLVSAVPEDFYNALSGFYDLNLIRNAEIYEQISEVTQALNRVNITPIWLKGASHLLKNGWKFSPRMMLDIDFWILDSSSHQDAFLALQNIGYYTPSQYNDNFDHHHYPPLFKDRAPVRIEFHKYIVEKKFSDLLPDDKALEQINWINENGLLLGELSQRDKALHALIQCIDCDPGFWMSCQSSATSMKFYDFMLLLKQDTAAIEQLVKFYESKLDTQWSKDLRKFFTFLTKYFGYESPFPPDTSLLKNLDFNSRHPKIFYAQYMYRTGIASIKNGTIGPIWIWPAKLLRHLKILIN